ncbi:MAG TPA: carboxypeptidase regulatory-like domain-containing protein, partial [Candidatus Acidoferrum sp.]|nr:carboxypeptidase regulatory-like domain-containing protein [Candidatus Acidoferrum sp.]
IATEAQNSEARQSRDLPTIDRAKALVPSVAYPASASGAAVATINQPNQGSFGGPIAGAAPGKMLGYVVDPSGAVVPNVRITVTPSNPGGTATAVTNSQGAWLIAGLPTGSYKAQAEAPGFRTTVLDLNYNADQPSLYRFTLDVGSTAETVEVSAENALVQTAGGSIGGTGPINGRNLTQLNTVTAGLMPRWAISATGGLQRSFDQGKTWQAVDVKTNPAYFLNADSSATSLQIADKASRTKVQKNKDSSKVAKQETVALTFRAVTAAGSDVWAGGSGGALYHSADAGNNWAPIVPASAGTTLTGDILSIDFPDAQHGKVSTSTSEVWMTGDGGQSWQKQ